MADQQSIVTSGGDILQKALQEAATECFESSSEHSNAEFASSNSSCLEPKPAPPVGSSQNPIQIIQQGNTYHSTQSLSQEQLQQIAQVLQQQQLVQATQKGGTSVLYNPVTNTRVVYRVIYPSQLHNKGGNSGQSSDKNGGSRGRGRGKVRKSWGRRSQDEEEKAEGSGPELSREEKEERKKHRPRTRSGRISKPPSYMVKDYKRIHHLDFNEDPYDDSDGGYSDFNVSAGSDHDDDAQSEDSKMSRLPAGVTTARRRNFKCGTCDKAYIGKGGLARHFRLNSGHGNADELESDDQSNATNQSAEDSNLMDQSCDSTEPKANVAGTSRRTEDVTIQLSPSLTDAVPESLTPESEKVSVEHFVRREPKVQRKVDPMRRKARLKGVMHQCDDEELMEVVMPRLAKVVSTWEFLLMKCEQGPNVDFANMYAELEDVLKRAAKVAQNCLVKPENQICSEHVDVTDEQVAKALGLTVGTYGVRQSESVESIQRFQKPQSVEQSIEDAEPEDYNPAEKRRRIEDTNDTYFLLEDPGCQAAFFEEPKSVADTVPQQIDEESTDAVIINESDGVTLQRTEDLDMDLEGCGETTCERKESLEEEVTEELSLEEVDDGKDAMAHQVCTMEMNEDGDILDVPDILQGNVVIVSNLSNGECEMTTYQIPETEVPIETVQALLAMNDNATDKR